MKIEKTLLEDCLLVTLDHHNDNRGVFFELYQLSRYENLVPQFNLKQINCSYSIANTVRGMHLAPYAKIVTCLSGRVFDVVIDMRKQSSTYLNWYGVELSQNNGKQLIVPANFAHGFMALEEHNAVAYSQNAIFQPGIEKTIHWREPKVNINWPIRSAYVLSEKDKIAKFLD